MPALVMQSHSQRDDDGGGSPLGAPRKNSRHMPHPDAGMTTRGACATLRDQDSEVNAATNDDNKDCFLCSCPSAPLSSACSISSASGLSNSPFLSHSLAGQAMTPLSMEGSDYNMEGEPAARKPGRPPTPFDALAGLSTLDELVTLAPQNAPEEAEESVEPAPRKSPSPLLAPPRDPLDTTRESRQPQDVSPELRDGRLSNTQHDHDHSSPAASSAPEQDVTREGAGNTLANFQDEPANTAFTDDTDRKRGLDRANGCARECDDMPGASQQPEDDTLTGHFGQTRAPVLGQGGCQRPNPDVQLQQRERQRCCQTEPAPAAAEPEPRSGSSAFTVHVPGGRAPPTSRPGLLDHSSPGANTHYPCAPEHDVPRPTDPSANGPNTAARARKINNTNPISRNSRKTATASRDPLSPFSSSASPPLPPSIFSLPLASSPVSIEQSPGHEESLPPLVRTTSDNSSLRIQHPIPDVNPKTGTLLGNIAQLEATAERLSSTTASIEDAIRDLHSELKRSDSQRSAATRARAGIQSSDHEAHYAGLASRLRRPASLKHPSASAALARRRTHSGRTATTNQPSRYRPRSSSLNTVVQSSADTDPYMSRAGPGKGSVASVKTGRQSLAEISESEPITLTWAAFSEADRSTMAHEHPSTTRPYAGHDRAPAKESFIPSTDAFHAMLNSGGHEPNSELFFNHPEPRAMQYLSVDDQQRPTTSASNASSTHTSNAFRDFDGVHCDPEANFLPPSPQPLPQLGEQPLVPPHSLRSESPPKPQPASYLDQETGQEMLFYPARVPAMLSLPPKLSKKPKAAARNQRQSHVLSTMPEIARRSGASWLPDPLAGSGDNSFLSPISLDTDDSFRTVTDQSPRPEDHTSQTTLHDETTTLDPIRAAPEIHVTPTPAEATDDDEVKPAVPRPRKNDTVDADARKSRLSKYNSNLPPQLRASAYFDMPSNTTKLEVKDGSAMATLDHLLDASMHAPVSAFTDHMIAGKLGSEVYGAEKTRSAAPKLQKSQPDLRESDDKKRGSLFHRVKKSEDFARSGRSESGASGRGDDEALPPGAVGYATLSPDSDEFDDNDRPDGEETPGSEDEDNEEYYGPPTTLLAELQIRKQQQKNRTRPINQAFPNGMHSTLLELDAVAEEQRKNRKGKRVNLAWEDPDPIAADAQSDDEDVPLGVLFAAKATGINDIAAASNELNRPIGLMERREMEENEPLSARRARLQGQDPAPKRQNLMPSSATRMGAHRLSQMAPFGPSVHHMSASPGTAEQDDEVEGETLGERMRRLKKKEEEELPKARPVSTAFSAELLGQFADPEDEKKEKEQEDANGAKGDGEEETLGQRRRRLQAESEGQARQPAAHPAPAKRLSMANILSAYPKRETTLQDAERRRAQEDMRAQRAQGEKLAAMRSQIPTSLEKPSVGAAAGGFGNGRFNDGTGGTGRRVRSVDVSGDLNRSSAVFGGGMIQQAGVSVMGTGKYAGYAAQHHGAGGHSPMARAGYYPQMQAPMGMPVQPQMSMPMQMPMGVGMPSQGQSDPIEKWRHSVMP